MAERNFEVTSSIFLKTKKCRFFGMGKCDRGSKCNFAHTLDDLRRAPDLRRTKMCPNYVATGACSDPSCNYAHNSDERRKMTGRARPSRKTPLAEGPVDGRAVDWGMPDSPQNSWNPPPAYGTTTIPPQDCIELPGLSSGTQSPDALGQEAAAGFGYPVQNITGQKFFFTYGMDAPPPYALYSDQQTFDYYGEPWQAEKFATTLSPSTPTTATAENLQQELDPAPNVENHLRVHNTFFTDEEPAVPLKHRLRRVRSEDILTVDKDANVENASSLLTILAMKACELEADMWCRSMSC